MILTVFPSICFSSVSTIAGVTVLIINSTYRRKQGGNRETERKQEGNREETGRKQRGKGRKQSMRKSPKTSGE